MQNSKRKIYKAGLWNFESNRSATSSYLWKGIQEAKHIVWAGLNFDLGNRVILAFGRINGLIMNSYAVPSQICIIIVVTWTFLLKECFKEGYFESYLCKREISEPGRREGT